MTRILSDEEVMAIYGSDEPGAVLSERFGVLQSTISGIRCGKTHKRLTGGGNCLHQKRKRPYKPSKKRKLDDAAALEVYHSEEKLRVLEEKYGLAKSGLSGIRRGRVYQNITKPAVRNL